MRSIFVGIEYAGKSTLIDLLNQYYRHRRLPTHLDDHFTIPDATLGEASRATFVNLSDDIKERFQRMQIQYHVEVIKNYANTMISGWHIEEAVYAKFYGDDQDHSYYPNYNYRFNRLYESQVVEAKLPDVVLIHVTADEATIVERMVADPHPYQIMREGDIVQLQAEFEAEIEQSLFTQQGRRVTLDTTGRSPQESLDDLLLLTERLITPGELAIRALTVPDGDYEIRYINGKRQLLTNRS